MNLFKINRQMLKKKRFPETTLVLAAVGKSTSNVVGKAAQSEAFWLKENV
jgi:hypothetical protein